MLDPRRLEWIAADGVASRDEVRAMAQALLAAHARRQSPATSRRAADRAKARITPVRCEILRQLAVSDRTDQELAAGWDGPPAADSSIRTRRRELVDLGYVEEAGVADTGYTVWTLTEQGRKAAAMLA